MKLLKLLAVQSMTLMIMLMLVYFFLKAISIENQTYVDAGWHTSFITGKPLLNSILVVMMFFLLISNALLAMGLRMINYLK